VLLERLEQQARKVFKVFRELKVFRESKAFRVQLALQDQQEPPGQLRSSMSENTTTL
jgi:hypothetical protein